MCLSYFLSPFLGMASYNKLSVFWSSWLQFSVQYDFSVSFSAPSLTQFIIFHTLCFTVCSFRDEMFKLNTKTVSSLHTDTYYAVINRH